MDHLRIFGVLLVVLQAASWTHAQLQCYTDFDAACGSAPVLGLASPADCCLGEGFWFDALGGEGCVPCRVYGWMIPGQPLDGDLTLVVEEQPAPIVIQVGFVKGFQLTRTLTVTNSSITADSSDYTLVTTDVTAHAVPKRMEAVELSIAVDSVALEGNETFELTLVPTTTVASNEFLLDKLTVIIQDKDKAKISLTPELVEVAEDVGTVEFTLTLTLPGPMDPLPVEIFVDLTAVGGVADEDDYVISTSFNSVPFNDSTREVSFSIAIIDDSLFELTEQVSLRVSSTNPLPVEITPNVSTIIILDNDNVTVGFDETEFTVPENEGPATLNVTTLSGALGTSVYLKLRSVDGTAKGTSDYSAITNHILELSEGNPTAQVTIDITDDDILEDDLEMFQVHLSLDGPVSEAITIDPSVADIYIRNVDAMLFQLRITGVSDCQKWIASEVDGKLMDIRDELQDKVGGMCSCGFTSQHITSGQLQCFNSSDKATYRARLSKTTSASSAEILGYLEGWISSGTASVVVEQAKLDIDSSCSPVVINSFDDPECTGTETSSSSSDKTDDSFLIAAIIGGVFASLIIAIIVIVIVICLLVRRRRRSSKAAHTEE